MTFPGTARYAAALAAFLGLFVLATGTAQAGVASVDGSVLSFKAKRGEVNDVIALRGFFDGSSGELFTDATSPIEAGSGCSLQEGGAFCPFPGTPPHVQEATIELRLGDRDDHGSTDNGFPVGEMRVFGGRGEDDVGFGTGGGANGFASGGPGDDSAGCSMNFSASCTLSGGAGEDELSSIDTFVPQMHGGRGDDRLSIHTYLFQFSPSRVFDGGKGNDTIAFAAADNGYQQVEAGRGFDTLTYENAGVGAFPGQANVDLKTCPACDVERVIGSPHDDTLIGDDGSTWFGGGAGNDTIDPGGGWDTVFAGAGDDQVNVADDFFDLASCGTDEDTATADRRDLLFRDCETVTR